MLSSIAEPYPHLFWSPRAKALIVGNGPSMAEELLGQLWPLLTEHPQLCKLTVLNRRGGVWLRAETVEGRPDGVFNVVEGYLRLLQILMATGIKLEHNNLPALYGSMLELMPSLQYINGIGACAIGIMHCPLSAVCGSSERGPSETNSRNSLARQCCSLQ